MTDQFGMPQHTTPMQKVWAEASAKYVVEQASKVREAAAKWGQSAAAILAVAGLATVFKGRETLDVLPEETRGQVIVAVMAVALFSGLALGLAAWAASGTVGWSWNDPESFRKAQHSAASSASKLLTASAWALVLAFACAIGTVWLIINAPKAPAAEQSVVVGPEGLVGCGALSIEDGLLLVDGTRVPAAPVSFYKTTDCPE